MKPGASQDIGSLVECLNGLLLSIGCNRYDTLDDLGSAEADAEGIHAALTSGPSALYDPGAGVILRSPTRAEIEAHLRTMLLQSKGVNSFVLYFAGHGAMVDGSLYLCPRDTSVDAISVTAINISQILRVVSELCPRHAYIIMDACHSSGIALDLGAILRSDILERSPSFGLSVLASAHVSRDASETAAGGLFTLELLKALRGEYLINDTHPLLGLGEIVRKLDLSSSLKEQAPTFWDLNLSGADIFCRNPRFSQNSSTDTSFGTFRYTQRHPILSDALLKRLWREYLELSGSDLANLLPLFHSTVQELCDAPETIEPASLAIAQSFATQLGTHDDTFAAASTRAMMVRALLAHRHILQSRKAIAAHLSLLYAEAHQVLAQLEDQLETDHYGLLGRGGLADLYYLPVRLARILGWVGLLMQISVLAVRGAPPLAQLRELVGSLLRKYGNSMVAVGEDQASALLLFLAQCKRHGWIDEAEEVVGRLYYDFNENYGRVLINEPSATDIVDYLLVKNDRPLNLQASYVQAPSELFSVILMGAAMFDLDVEIDFTLIQIDHAAFSFYIPSSYIEFWREDMETGMTIVFQLGHGLTAGHGVWNIQDMRRAWRHDIEPLVKAAHADCDETDLVAAALMSLVLPDRLAWFTVPPLTFRASNSSVCRVVAPVA